MRRRSTLTLAGLAAVLLTWSTVAATASTASATTASRKANAYVPKNAMACEYAATRNSPKYWKKCNFKSKVGAGEKVTIQVGGCGDNEGSAVVPVCDFTAAGMECYGPIEAPSLKVGAFEAGGIAVDDLEVSSITVDTLTVTGTSIHAGLETFNGGIAVDNIHSAGDGDITIGGPSTTVNVPGELSVETLTVTGTSTHDGLETFNGNIATNRIYSTNTATTSVSIPGSGTGSSQIGGGAIASGLAAVAVGLEVEALGTTSIAIGISDSTVPRKTQASAYASMAIGYLAIADGNTSTAIGHWAGTTPDADLSACFGFKAVATVPNAIVLSADTNGITAVNPGFYVKPIREVATTGSLNKALYWDSTSGEIRYDDGARRLEETTALEARVEELEAQIKALTEMFKARLA